MRHADVTKLKRALSRNAERGLSAYIDLYGFIDPQTILTYNGTLLVGYELAGIDYEGLEEEELMAKTLEFAKHLQSIDQECVVYQWMHRRKVSGVVAQGDDPVYRELAANRKKLFEEEKAFFETRLFMAIEFPLKPVKENKSLRELLPKETLAWIDAIKRGEGIARLKSKVREYQKRRDNVLEVGLSELKDYVQEKVISTLISFERAMANLGPVRMDYQSFFEAMLPILNPEPDKWRVRCVHPAPLDHHLQLSSYDLSGGRHIRIDDSWVDVFTLKSTAEALTPRVLGKLDELPFELMVSTTWARIAEEKAEGLINRQRRGFKHQLRFGNPNRDSGNDIQAGYRQDIVNHLDHALRELKNDDTAWFGRMSVTVMITAKSETELERRKAAVRTIFYDASLIPFDEDINLFFAWVSMLPGGFWRHNFRKLVVTNRNLAAFAPIWRLENGQARSEHYRGPALSLLETRAGNLYHFNLSHKDNLNFMALGKIGSGKSFFLKYHILEYLKYGECFFWIHTKGKDYHDLARLCSGQVVELDADGSFPLNLYVLSDELSSGYLNVLLAVWRFLFAAINHEMTEEEEHELAQKLPILFRQAPEARCNRALWDLCSARLKPHLAEFICDESKEGRYGRLFDGRSGDARSFTQLDHFTVIEYSGLLKDQNPALAQACMTLITYMQDRVIYARETKSIFKFMFLDEGEKIVGHRDSFLAQYLKRAGDTWRKENTSLGFVTQRLDHLVHLDLVTLFREACSQFLFFPNAGIQSDQYRQHFDFMSDREIDLVKTMEEKREVLLKTTYGVSKVLRLVVDDFTRLVIESNPHVVARKEQLFDEVGFPENIRQLMREERAKFAAEQKETESFGVL